MVEDHDFALNCTPRVLDIKAGGEAPAKETSTLIAFKRSPRLHNGINLALSWHVMFKRYCKGTNFVLFWIVVAQSVVTVSPQASLANQDLGIAGIDIKQMPRRIEPGESLVQIARAKEEIAPSAKQAFIKGISKAWIAIPAFLGGMGGQLLSSAGDEAGGLLSRAQQLALPTAFGTGILFGAFAIPTLTTDLTRRFDRQALIDGANGHSKRAQLKNALSLLAKASQRGYLGALLGGLGASIYSTATGDWAWAPYLSAVMSKPEIIDQSLRWLPYISAVGLPLLSAASVPVKRLFDTYTDEYLFAKLVNESHDHFSKVEDALTLHGASNGDIVSIMRIPEGQRVPQKVKTAISAYNNGVKALGLASQQANYHLRPNGQRDISAYNKAFDRGHKTTHSTDRPFTGRSPLA